MKKLNKLVWCWGKNVFPLQTIPKVPHFDNSGKLNCAYQFIVLLKKKSSIKMFTFILYFYRTEYIKNNILREIKNILNNFTSFKCCYKKPNSLLKQGIR